MIHITGKKCFTLSIVLTVFLLLYSYHEIKKQIKQCNSFSLPNTEQMWKLQLNFAKLNFSNDTGSQLGYYVVPNYVHYIHFGGRPINYIYFICLLSVLKNQRPEKIFFHYNDRNTFTGKYWKILETLPGFKDVIICKKINLPEKIFSQTVNQKWHYQHASSFLRILILMEYGGIYLDTDCYLVKDINNFRRFEATISWNEGFSMGNHIIVAHKDARFLRRYRDCFREYDKTDRCARDKPTSEILRQEPHLVHRVRELFGDNRLVHQVYGERWPRWRDMYIVHLLPNSQHLLHVLSYNMMAKFPVQFNENNIAYYPIALRDMAYDTYYTDFIKLNWTMQKLDLLYKRKVVMKKPEGKKINVNKKVKSKVNNKT